MGVFLWARYPRILARRGATRSWHLWKEDKMLEGPRLRVIQGYLVHKKPPPPGTYSRP